MSNNREINRKNMISFFERGIKKQGSPLQFGVEMEHFVVDREGKSVPYAGINGIEGILMKLSGFYTGRQEAEGHLIGLYSDEMSVSLEPAAQIEVSIAPKTDTEEIIRIYNTFRKETDPILMQYGYHLVTMGYQPVSRVNELSLIPKKRYELMDRYFQTIGKYGRQMMRGTASAQVSIDYYSEADFSLKYRLAYQLLPLFSRLCANTVIYEGEETDNREIRQKIWEKTDPRRVDVAPFMKDGTLDFQSYTDFIMQAPVIVELGESLSEDEERYCETIIGELCDNRILGERELEHVLSMVFPMIRLKNYLEIRVADSMPVDSVRCYVLLIKGIFTACDRFSTYLDDLAKQQKTPFADMETFYQMVFENLNGEEQAYLERYHSRITNGQTIL